MHFWYVFGNMQITIFVCAVFHEIFGWWVYLFRKSGITYEQGKYRGNDKNDFWMMTWSTKEVSIEPFPGEKKIPLLIKWLTCPYASFLLFSYLAYFSFLCP